MLKTWRSSYLETRAKIESSGRDARWEFDRKRLFERTDYVASICQSLHEAAQVSQSVSQSVQGFLCVFCCLPWSVQVLRFFFFFFPPRFSIGGVA